MAVAIACIRWSIQVPSLSAARLRKIGPHRPGNKSRKERTLITGTPKVSWPRMGQPHALEIMTFGDSLTEGYTQWGTAFHPYSNKLAELLSRAELTCNVRERGVSGELACDMPKRLGNMMSEAKAEGIKYDWILILGGINDIGQGCPASQVLQALQQMYSMSLEHGAKVVGMTVLEVADLRPGDSQEHQRKELNQGLRKHFAADSCRSLHLFDLEAALPYFSLAPNKKEDLWDDGLHLTSRGYDKMAEMLFEFMMPLLSGSNPTGDVASSPAAPPFTAQ